MRRPLSRALRRVVAPLPCLVAAAALVLAAGAAGGGPGALLLVLALAVAALGLVLWARERRDPNGPPGQH